MSEHSASPILTAGIRKSRPKGLIETFVWPDDFPDVAEGGSSLLHKAVASGDALIVRRLLNAGADANALDACGCTPLHVSVYCRKAKTRAMVRIVADLISHGVDVSVKDELERTAGELAAKIGLSDIANLCWAVALNKRLPAASSSQPRRRL
jgi:ankyrin repeat protein